MERSAAAGLRARIGGATRSRSGLTERRGRRGRIGALLATVLAAAAATAGIALVEGRPFGVEDASAIYLVAVVVAATFGARAAVATAFATFVLYDLLFVEPRFTLTVDDPREWLDLVLLLVVGVVVGRLAGLQADRAREAERRLREATGLFQISRTLATAESTGAALPAVVAILVGGTDMDAVRVTRSAGGRELVEADGGEGPAPEPGPIASVLVRRPGEEPARWVVAHQADPARRSGARGETGIDLYRVRIEIDADAMGSIWATRARVKDRPTREETRLLALAADQVGLAWRRERFAAEAKDADVARRGELLQRALLKSVSHDLRTPLSSIRAGAGHLADPDIEWSPDDRRAAARQIDAEAERLNELVRNLLDLSRIEGGALVSNLEPWDLSALLEPVVRRIAPSIAPATVRADVPPDLPPVSVDPVLFDQAMANILENAARHAPGAPVSIAARAIDGRVRLRVEDAGPGVPAAALPRLFERFYRARTPGEGARRGLGIGLSVVRAAVEAMGGRTTAEPAAGGGLAIVIDLPTALPPPEAETVEPVRPPEPRS